jgi:hypothetical protein
VRRFGAKAARLDPGLRRDDAIKWRWRQIDNGRLLSRERRLSWMTCFAAPRPSSNSRPVPARSPPAPRPTFSSGFLDSLVP